MPVPARKYDKERIMKNDFPILEFDENPNAVISPRKPLKPLFAPKKCVLCFFPEVIEKLRKQGALKVIARLKSELAPNPLYKFEYHGESLGLIHPGLGGPFSAIVLETLIAYGFEKFIACGSAGVLDRDIAAGHVIVPVSAVRDEGLSYHYLPPSREVQASPEAVAAIEDVMKENEVDYLLTKTWTTDGVYRETPNKIAMRRKEGCLAVEMEAASMFAVAKFRGVIFGQILYGGDDVSGKKWKHRNFLKLTSARQRIFDLAAQACARLT